MTESPTDTFGKIAVIGMAGRFPGAWNAQQFWENVKQGKECITFFSDEELQQAGVSQDLIFNPKYVKARGVCPGTFLFDASFFGYTPREAEFLDPQHRVFLECACEALEHAGYDSWGYPGRIGLFAGSGSNQYLFELMSIPGIEQLADAFTLSTYNDKDYLATRVGYKLNFRGPCVTVQTACSTSLVSIAMACQSLLSFQSDIALGGGVTLITRGSGGYLYREGGIQSPDGHCRAFDAEARGIVGGEGVGVVVLKRLEDALADGDTIHALVLGTGLGNDGCERIGFSAPGVNGQAAVTSDAIAMAGINPESVGYVECHGTATPLGDPIEIKALTRAFQAYTQKKNFCGVGSVKTNIGHADAAAGVAGFIKAVLALKDKVLPPSLHFHQPNPEIDFASSPFYVTTELRAWAGGDAPRRAGVNSFGLGGTNAHVVLEEAPEQGPSGTARPWNLLVWSGKTDTAVEAMSRNLLDHLRTHTDQCADDIAYTLQLGRRVFAHRRALVCRDRHDAINALQTSSRERLLAGQRDEKAGPLAFLFPGQGAQHINMGKQLYLHEKVFREQVDCCAQILKPSLELDLREILYPSPDQADNAAVMLDQIKYTTPILFTVEYALAKLWLDWGARPMAMIGHSTGEYAAACVAGVFSLKDALRLVAARGRLMQQLPAGCMTSVMLSEGHLAPLLAEVGRISLAAINGPSACVVSGCPESMRELEAILAKRRVSHRRLHISHAAHSEMMDPILEDFRHELRKTRFNEPQLPYLSNLSGTWAGSSEVADPDYWIRHMRGTVRFSQGVSELLKSPTGILLEMGPGRMLSTLVTQHPQRGPEHSVLSSLPHPKNDPQGELEFILTTAGLLWLEGIQINWAAFHGGERRRRIPLPTYPFERQRYQLTMGVLGRSEGAGSEVSSCTATAEVQGLNGSHSSLPVRATHSRPRLSTPYVAPRNELEQAIAAVWQDMLGIDAPGINDNFTTLGGHSLLAIQVAARISDLFEVELSVANMYQAATIAGLADTVVQKLTEGMNAESLDEILSSLDAAPKNGKDSEAAS